MTSSIGLLGAGHQALEVAEFASTAVVVFYAVASPYLDASRPEIVDISTHTAALLATPVIGAVGAPGLRRELVHAWGGRAYATVISERASVSGTASIGAGCVIAPMAVISAQARIGDHVLVNLGATISHNTILGDFTTVSPGAHIAGDCVLGAGVFVGIGAAIAHRVRIAAGTIIGAGAVIVESITRPGTYVGVPARPIHLSEEWLRDL